MKQLAIAIASIAVMLLVGCSNDGRVDANAPTSSTKPTRAATTTTSAPPCALAPAAGDTEVHLTSGGLDRWYLLHVPPGTTPKAGWPVVFDFHGLIEGARIHSLATQMGAYGDTKGFVTVFPQGTGDPAFWNATKVDGVVDDMAYTKDMIASVKASVCVDGARIYASGLSDGAFMVSRLACDMADTFAAVAPVAGVNTMEGSCTPARAVPVIAIHGTDDKFVAYGGNGGSSAASLGVTADSVATLLMLKLGPVPDTAAAWAKRNGCAEGPTDTPIGDDVVKRSWTKCDGGADVVLLTVNGGGHTWPGSAFFANVAKIVGRTTETIDANEQMWDFFKAHPLKIQ